MNGKKRAAYLIIFALILAAAWFMVTGKNPYQGKREEISKGQDEAYGKETPKVWNEIEIPERNEEEQRIRPETVSVVPPIVTPEMPCGVDGPILDYADEHLIIFHDYFGLFAYDIVENKIIGAIDLAAIGCEFTQGDHACEVLTDSNGWKVYLHPLKEESMFVYDVLNNRLTKEPYDPVGKEAFHHLEETADYVDSQPYLRSFSCALLGQERYLYLESESGMALDLYYIIEENQERIKFAKIFDGYTNMQEGGEIFAYADYTGYLDECTDWMECSQFQERDYDKDGLWDRVYRENLSDFESCNYRIEFGNGDLIRIPQMGGGIPHVMRCDLDGDDTSEILFQQSYGFSTDPMAFGEVAVFAKKNGTYEQLMPPKELRTDLQDGLNCYRPSLALYYEKQSEWEMRVTTKELGKGGILDEIVPLNDDLAAMFNWTDVEKEHVASCYETTVSGEEKQLLEFHFQVFNKWSLDEIVVTAAYEDGELGIVDSRYERETD